LTTPLVFLHPLGADARFWDPVRAELGDHPSVALDLPGHGSAQLPRLGAGIDVYGQAVAQQLDGPAHLIGMSLGGLVAQEIALRRSELVASIVLADTVPVYPESFRKSWRERACTARTSGLSSLVEPMVNMWFSAELAAGADPRVQHARRTFVCTDPEGYARSCDVLAEVDFSDRLTSISVPATVVCGQDDVAAFRDGATWLADTIGDGTVHWLPGRHACVVENPAKFAELLAITTA
jgi:3-oxoadipate enol-lactonase